MQTLEHIEHIRSRTAHSDCDECQADNERRFARTQPFVYGFVHEYVSYVRPRLAAIRQGENSANARIWHRDFVRALHRRINSHAAGKGRKWSDSYLERLGQFRFPGSKADAEYLRAFAARRASCLQ